MPYPRSIYIALVAWLLFLNIAGFFLRDIPAPPPTGPLTAPVEVLHYHGVDLPHRPEELAILAPAKVLSRRYERPGLEIDPQPIWLNMLESGSIGTLHNFYDSLVASGTKPRILGTLVTPTEKGPLKTAVIQYSNRHGKLFYLLLWYQWDGGNAENRWRWYEEILKLRLQRKSPAWQLVEIATPETAKAASFSDSPDVKRLQSFAKVFYEKTNAPTP